MARVNVEDDIFFDVRFQALVRRLGGDLEKALGRLFRFWLVAQKHWGQNRGLIPAPEFDLGDFDHLEAVGLAERRELGVYAKGAEKHFDWYAQRVEAGKKRAQGARNADGTFTSGHPAPLDKSSSGRPADIQRGDQRPPAASQPLTLTLTPTHASLGEKHHAVSSDRRRGVDPRPLASAWNEHRHPVMPALDLPRFRSGTPRWRSAGARLVDHPELAYWVAVIQRIARSSFCRGEIEARDGRKPWVANFDFLVRSETHLKVLEGRYDDVEGGGSLEPGSPEWRRIVFGPDWEASP